MDDDSPDLVQRCLAGDEAAQRELVSRYAGLCLRIASRILSGSDRSCVEDAVQEAFYAIFAKLGQWQGQNLPAWIGAVAARRAMDVRRRLRRTRAEKTGLDDTVFASLPAASRPADLADLREAMYKARGALTARQRRVLDALLKGMTRDQIARELGVSPRTVYYDLGEIRRHVADFLGPVADSDDSERL